MFGKWRDSHPRHVLDSPHLKIKYDAVEETASGFILSENKDKTLRKYTFEAALRKAGWGIVLTVGDPLNTRPFSNHDRDPQRFRPLSGMPKFHRQDIKVNLELKLKKFRDAILCEEDKLRILKDKARFLQNDVSGDEYWLAKDSLIRVSKSPFREILVSLETKNLSLDEISAYIV